MQEIWWSLEKHQGCLVKVMPKMHLVIRKRCLTSGFKQDVNSSVLRESSICETFHSKLRPLVLLALFASYHQFTHLKNMFMVGTIVCLSLMAKNVPCASTWLWQNIDFWWARHENGLSVSLVFLILPLCSPYFIFPSSISATPHSPVPHSILIPEMWWCLSHHQPCAKGH